MDLIPATTVTVLTTTVGDIVAANALVIVGVLATGVGIAFAMRWFNKATRRVKA